MYEERLFIKNDRTCPGQNEEAFRQDYISRVEKLICAALKKKSIHLHSPACVLVCPPRPSPRSRTLCCGLKSTIQDNTLNRIFELKMSGTFSRPKKRQDLGYSTGYFIGSQGMRSTRCNELFLLSAHIRSGSQRLHRAGGLRAKKYQENLFLLRGLLRVPACPETLQYYRLHRRAHLRLRKKTIS